MKQQLRLFALVMYVGILFVASRFALDQWYPPANEKGLWFFTGLAALLLGNLLVSPFFTKPADAIANGAAALVAMLAVNVLAADDRATFEKVLWSFVTGYISLVLVIAILAITLRGQSGSLMSAFSAALYRLSDKIGDPRPVFSAVFFFAVLVFHRESGREFAILLGVGLVVVALRPVETLIAWVSVAWRSRRGILAAEVIGEVMARQEPGLLIVQRTSDPGWTWATCWPSR